MMLHPPQGNGGIDTTDVEPTSFNPQTVTILPADLCSERGGTTASNSDVAHLPMVTMYTLYGNKAETPCSGQAMDVPML